MTPPEPGAEARAARIGPWTLFCAFALIGVSGFGGVLPIARHELVVRRRWLTPAEFTEILSLSQFVPGPNVIILAIAFGMRSAGLAGAAAAYLGLTVLPVALVLVLAGVYDAVSELEPVRDAFRGIAAAAAGVIVAMAARMAAAADRGPRALAVAAAAFAAIVLLRVPLVAAVAVLAPLSIALARWRRHG